MKNIYIENFLSVNKSFILDVTNGQKLNFENIHLSVLDHKLYYYFKGKRVKTEYLKLIGGIFRLRTDKKESLYNNSIFIRLKKDEIILINNIKINDYLQGVVNSEIEPYWQKEAIKAQAVVARTYMFANLRRHKDDGYNLCDLTHCQVFKGLSDNMDIKYALNLTKGEILTYKGKPIQAIYHSTCAGHTADNNIIFGGKQLVYLKGIKDFNNKKQVYCKKSPFYQTWKFKLKKQELLKILQSKEISNPGNVINDLLIIKNSYGIVEKVIIKGEKIKHISGYKFWLLMGQKIGWGKLKSVNFDIKNITDNYYEFSGKGLGHLVGMCQWGSNGMACSGKTYTEILKHYYPGTIIDKIY